MSVRALDKLGLEHRATFVLHVPKGDCNHAKAKLMSESNLRELLRVGVSNTRLTQLVLDCGVSFQLTPSTEERLRAEGAQDGLMQTIQDPLKAEQQGLGPRG